MLECTILTIYSSIYTALFILVFTQKKPETSSSANNKKLEKSANLDAKGAQPKQTEMAGKVELSKSTVTPQSPVSSILFKFTFRDKLNEIYVEGTVL